MLQRYRRSRISAAARDAAHGTNSASTSTATARSFAPTTSTDAAGAGTSGSNGAASPARPVAELPPRTIPRTSNGDYRLRHQTFT